ncbi:MAG: PD-(D/E)XK nuclease family protein [Parcubacteria group bacterium]|nr:PD-(D/E)XK nuclease family protein [Parcubacteria group bacterium]
MQSSSGSKKKKIWLSPSGLSLLSRCPRCFWLQYRRGIRQPEGIQSRLANRFDGVIKAYFDTYRGGDVLPPLVAGQVEGKLEHPFQETYFYHHDDDYGLMGKLDECLVRADGTFTPVDHKTASSDPRTRDLLPAYQTQLDIYAFLLGSNRKKPSGIGHLIYFYPADGADLHEGFQMEVIVKTLDTSTDAAHEKFMEGVAALEGEMPFAADNCPFCLWYDAMTALLEK